MIIDAHVHLWKVQEGLVDGKPVREIGGGRADFGVYQCDSNYRSGVAAASGFANNGFRLMCLCPGQ